jgi:hypothetical protein
VADNDVTESCTMGGGEREEGEAPSTVKQERKGHAESEARQRGRGRRRLSMIPPRGERLRFSGVVAGIADTFYGGPVARLRGKAGGRGSRGQRRVEGGDGEVRGGPGHGGGLLGWPASAPVRWVRVASLLRDRGGWRGARDAGVSGGQAGPGDNGAW